MFFFSSFSCVGEIGVKTRSFRTPISEINPLKLPYNHSNFATVCPDIR